MSVTLTPSTTPRGLDSLPREDVVHRCKSLLVIAQKAKAARDEKIVEIEKLTESIQTLQSEYDDYKSETSNTINDLKTQKEEQKATFTRKNAELKEETEHWKVSHEDLVAKLYVSEGDLNQKSKRIVELEEESENAKSEICDLTSAIDKLQHDTSLTTTQQQTTIQHLETNNTELQLQLDDVKLQLDNLTETLTSNNQDLE